MGDLYLTDLARWLRGAGLDVVELEGWEHRARGSGGYDDLPLCVMWHHTASSGGDGTNDAAYCTYADEDAPLTNLVIGNTGIVYVCAGGATNTNGKGDSQIFSRGICGDDNMNAVALGIEISNSGVGQPYPQAQIDACFTASNVCNENFGNVPEDCCTHQHYAPTRKIDPATATAVLGPWRPGAINSSGSWSVDDLRAECRRRAESGSTGEIDMPLSDEDVQKVAKAVWDHMIDTAPGDEEPSRPARYILHRGTLIVRQYLGGFSGNEPPRVTMLRQIHDNVKQLLDGR